MAAYFGDGGENLLEKDSSNAWESFAKSSGEWSRDKNDGYDWGGVFGSLFKKAAQKAVSGSDSYGQPFGGNPTGNQRVSKIDAGHTMFTQGGDWSPIVIPGQRAQGFGGPLGTLAGIGASFIPGLGPGIAAAMPAIGGSIGSMF